MKARPMSLGTAGIVRKHGRNKKRWEGVHFRVRHLTLPRRRPAAASVRISRTRSVHRPCRGSPEGPVGCGWEVPNRPLVCRANKFAYIHCARRLFCRDCSTGGMSALTGERSPFTVFTRFGLSPLQSATCAVVFFSLDRPAGNVALGVVSEEQLQEQRSCVKHRTSCYGNTEQRARHEQMNRERCKKMTRLRD